ncbi:K+/H+ antiporter subunit F [Paracoccus luteus]|uniref:K+/H+ antiporter subunit F n=1 Tax=Paracoccus luteus TaxID=2508543 RepID=UPI00106F27A8|nr:K+/H+ antiporter subunit F [Paracoccus luteus]
MSETILTVVLGLSQLCLIAAMLLAAMRLLRGPRAQDRVLSLDALYVCGMLLLVVTGMRVGSAYLFEGALVIGAFGFVSTVALSKFLLRGEVIE